jgi:hypothetical protein
VCGVAGYLTNEGHVTFVFENGMGHTVVEFMPAGKQFAAVRGAVWTHLKVGETDSLIVQEKPLSSGRR